MTISSANKGWVVEDAPAPCGGLRAGPCARCPPRRARGGGRRAGAGPGTGAGAGAGGRGDGGCRPAGSRGAAAAGERGRGAGPGWVPWLRGCCTARALPSASPVFISPFSQAENLLCRLQENFQALTEKLTLRNILFGTWGTRGWISDPVAGALCALMGAGGVFASNSGMGFCLKQQISVLLVTKHL